MSSNLPEKPDAVLSVMGGQAALFDDPLQVLALDDARFTELVAVVRQGGESLIAGIRHYVGLLAWAAWHRYDEKRYREFVADFAQRLGVEPRNVLDWRRAVTKKSNLPLPPVAKARSDARKGAGQTPGNTKSVLIPAASTEAPAKSSEGEGSDGLAASTSGSPASATGHPSPSDPHVEDTTDVHVDVDAIGLRWLKSKTTQQVRAIGDPWGPAIRAEVRRWAEAFGAPPAPAEKPQRRQTTITRPQAAVLAGRAISTPVNGSGKRHALDCSCLGCKSPKAVGK